MARANRKSFEYYTYEHSPYLEKAHHKRSMRWLLQGVLSLMLLILSISLLRSDGGKYEWGKSALRSFCTQDADFVAMVDLWENYRSSHYVRAAAVQNVVAAQMQIPASGTVVCDYGWIADVNGNFQQGVIIETETAEKIKAVDRGKITEISCNEAGKYDITIEHDNGLCTFYGNCEAVTVQIGTIVQKGDVIGSAGDTTVQRGQVYFAAKHYGEPINPLSLLEDKEI